ncbi:MFS transporter [Streptomyces gibsoniae]|uniref:MFS transporter n=1 Tax=Streptomyces gibsoniae TaxID=3075529 RepID=A0ABU2TMY3_9ACTN|nr:MFS transporter [Streptomyces sp. DSM 41699]MDT0462296.1 MFS transporter [Streptomyces sp. DSM 41699]
MKATTSRADATARGLTHRPFARTFTAPLYVGSSLNPINSSLIATALVPIAGELHISVGSTAVPVSSLYLASAVAQPTAGKLAEVLGARRIFLSGIVLVLLGGLVGGLGRHLGAQIAIVLVSLVFGVTSATTTIGNQTALYLAAPPDRIGTGSGLFRTFGYLGTVTSAVIGSIVFRDGASDHGLHILGTVLVAAGPTVLLLTVLDRRLTGRDTSRWTHTPEPSDHPTTRTTKKPPRRTE